MDKAHETRELDLSGAARGVWLVKVPKYLSEKWKRVHSHGTTDVGKLRITNSKVPGTKPEVIFSLSDKLATKEPQDKHDVPKDHKFVLTKLTNQNLALMGREPIEDAATSEITGEKVSVEGRVIQRAECRPIVNDRYIELKRYVFEQSNKPQREIVHLEKAVISYKPRSIQPTQVENDKLKGEQVKRSRLDKDKVMDMLFSAFEKHQYYNLKDLVRITNQPVTHLKDILKELCTYNMKQPHKNMWELKAENRHYKGDDDS